MKEDDDDEQGNKGEATKEVDDEKSRPAPHVGIRRVGVCRRNGQKPLCTTSFMARCVCKGIITCSVVSGYEPYSTGEGGGGARSR